MKGKKMDYYVVWNKTKIEGFITNDEKDAKQCASGKFGFISSTMGEAFHDAYGDSGKLKIQKIEL
jgi:hypothetical protein